MFRKFFSINLALSLIFLLTTVFPASLFSYETTDRWAEGGSESNWTDESIGYKPVVYEKVRCPRCGMEFYYVPGKEDIHSHWVHYEVSEQDLDDSASSSLKEKREEDRPVMDKGKELLGLLKDKSSKQGESKETVSGAIQKEQVFSQLQEVQRKHYKLRQKLTCPYDGHGFFPEGDVIEDIKLMQKRFAAAEEISTIEASFSRSIPFGISKELKQFGYDLFAVPEEETIEGKKTTSALSQDVNALGMFGVLTAALGRKTQSPTLSDMGVSSQTAVVPVSPDYIIGPGDNLVVNIWGSVQESFPIEVDREGKIMLPKAGPLYVWGLKLKDTEIKIKQRLDRHYTNFYMDLSMGKLRDIQVYIMGEIKKPGSYNVSSQATVFQALYKAGGPTKLGSLRTIKLMHGDGKKEIIDIYPFLLEGELIRPTRIQSGDTIFVPTIGDVVAVAGNVKRPAIYETKSEIPLQDLLGFAGGITPTGDLQRLQIERIENNERRVMLDVELRRSDVGRFSMEGVNIQNGDIVMVSPVVRLRHDFVSVIGNVERPGEYALSEDMKVSDLLERAKGFLPGTYLSRAEIARVTKNRTREIIPVDLDKIMLGTEEDLFLDEWDILLVYSQSEVKAPSFIEIDGAVNRPGRYELTPHIKISDLIFKAGGVKSDQVIRGGELFHIMPGEQPVVRRVEIKHMSDGSVLVDKDIMLRAGDALSIQSEPKLTERRIADIRGEVKFPGIYSIREGERLSSLIERAGGFTEEAFLDGAVFTRKSIREMQEGVRRRFIARENKTLLEEQQSLLLRRGATMDSAGVTESIKMRREMLDYVEKAEIEGRMVIKLKPIALMKDAKYDILLEKGDVLTIPQTPSATTVMGSVNSPASVPFEPGKGIEYYIRKTGGLTKHADKAGIYVIKANGEALSKFMMSKKVALGDTIVVPQEFKYWTPPGQLLRDTMDILSRVAIGIGIIAALD